MKIRLGGPGGLPRTDKILKTTYASGMDFEPDERRMTITPDGTVELQVNHSLYMVHVKMQVPLYGQLWVMANDLGEGYTGDFVDFVSEAVRTYIAHTKRFGEGIELSVKTRGHLEAAIELDTWPTAAQTPRTTGSTPWGMPSTLPRVRWWNGRSTRSTPIPAAT